VTTTPLERAPVAPPGAELHSPKRGAAPAHRVIVTDRDVLLLYTPGPDPQTIRWGDVRSCGSPSRRTGIPTVAGSRTIVALGGRFWILA